MSAKIIISFAVLCAILGTLNAVDVNVDPQSCAEICTFNYNPVCGTDGQYYKEFANECQMNVYNCQMQRSHMKPYVATHIDMCRTEMVDGLDNLMVKMGNLKMYTPECLKLCPKIYMPVCISNGKYRSVSPNSCIVDIVNCEVGTKDAFKVIRNDTC